MTTSDEARAELESTIGDAIGEGYTIESQIGDRYVISRPVRNVWRPITGLVGVAIAVAVLLWVSLLIGVVLLVGVIVWWVIDSRRRTRFQVFVNDQGEVVQERARA